LTTLHAAERAHGCDYEVWAYVLMEKIGQRKASELAAEYRFSDADAT
jgi:hypothetical protein